MTLAPTRFKFTIDDFYALDSLGIFTDKVELWDGDIIEATINPPHGNAVTRLLTMFARYLAEKVLIASQSPLYLGERDKLPQPDGMLLRPGNYRTAQGSERHPEPQDVLLLIEVADTTLLDDQPRKLKAYADHNVQEYWVADLNHRTWFIYRDPQGDDYQFKTTYHFGEAFAPLAFLGIAQPWLAEQSSFAD
jgi:Uma2 family endonuclease